MDNLIELLKFKCEKCWGYTNLLIDNMCVSCKHRHWEWRLEKKK